MGSADSNPDFLKPVSRTLHTVRFGSKGDMMSLAGLHAAEFYKEANESGQVRTIRDSGGFPAPKGDAARAMPFWSSRSRVEKIIASVPAYRGFDPFEIDLSTFRDRWLPGLQRDELKAGLNWSGDRAVGYDVDPQTVADGLAHVSAAGSL